jgi:hypothetical protein
MWFLGIQSSDDVDLFDCIDDAKLVVSVNKHSKVFACVEMIEIVSKIKKFWVNSQLLHRMSVLKVVSTRWAFVLHSLLNLLFLETHEFGTIIREIGRWLDIDYLQLIMHKSK